MGLVHENEDSEEGNPRRCASPDLTGWETLRCTGKRNTLFPIFPVTQFSHIKLFPSLFSGFFFIALRSSCRSGVDIVLNLAGLPPLVYGTCGVRERNTELISKEVKLSGLLLGPARSGLCRSGRDGIVLQ